MSPSIQTSSFAEVSVRTNLRCQACLEKIKPVLDGVPEIKTWSVDLSDPRKIITAHVASSQPYDVLQNALQLAGYSAEPLEGISPSPSAPAAIAIESHQKTGLVTYKPLFLVVSYVLGFAALMCWATGEPTVRAFMRYFMGGFFLGFAFFKLLDVSAFADAFSTYDFVAKRTRVYALAYPFIELGLGIAYVLGKQLAVVNLLTALVMAVGLVGVVKAVAKKQAIQCACLGTVFNLPMSVVTIVENSAMLTMALLDIVLM